MINMGQNARTSGDNFKKFVTLKMAAIFFCWGREQWFSMESIRGKGEATNALLSMTLTTSRKEILVVSV